MVAPPGLRRLNAVISLNAVILMNAVKKSRAGSRFFEASGRAVP
jgi:hypothetical protein